MKTQALTGRLAPFHYMESPSLNGIAFNDKPQATVAKHAVACGLPLRELLLALQRPGGVPFPPQTPFRTIQDLPVMAIRLRLHSAFDSGDALMKSVKDAGGRNRIW